MILLKLDSAILLLPVLRLNALQIVVSLLYVLINSVLTITYSLINRFREQGKTLRMKSL